MKELRCVRCNVLNSCWYGSRTKNVDGYRCMACFPITVGQANLIVAQLNVALLHSLKDPAFLKECVRKRKYDQV